MLVLFPERTHCFDCSVRKKNVSTPIPSLTFMQLHPYANLLEQVTSKNHPMLTADDFWKDGRMKVEPKLNTAPNQTLKQQHSLGDQTTQDTRGINKPGRGRAYRCSLPACRSSFQECKQWSQLHASTLRSAPRCRCHHKRRRPAGREPWWTSCTPCRSASPAPASESRWLLDFRRDTWPINSKIKISQQSKECFFVNILNIGRSMATFLFSSYCDVWREGKN